METVCWYWRAQTTVFYWLSNEETRVVSSIVKWTRGGRTSISQFKHKLGPNAFRRISCASSCKFQRFYIFLNFTTRCVRVNEIYEFSTKTPWSFSRGRSEQISQREKTLQFKIYVRPRKGWKVSAEQKLLYIHTAVLWMIINHKPRPHYDTCRTTISNICITMLNFVSQARSHYHTFFYTDRHWSKDAEVKKEGN